MVVLKWSKTLQNRAKIATISILALGQSTLCPWRALRETLGSFPLFQVPSPVGVILLTDSVACKHLKDVSRCVGFYKTFIFHDFRQYGITWAFDMAFLCRISRPKVLSLPVMCGCIFNYLPLRPPLSPLHFVTTYLYDYISTGCFGSLFLSCYHYVALSAHI